ncbi:AAA family ATPase [Sulfurimonas sp.]|uniref:ATP-binding protein n=1 Tax=Sulfurimonas sp. TaxID=2022749 RepID=UPI002A36983E|nr:AAA family ATPase [Sulfurimonas sp.]MDY0122927.1 AAA family ATPase [Sulfurimonas sp.]
MQLKKLPIGIQTFSDIRKDDYVYVDKTDIAFNLIESYRYAFLARPRRFGKSLFLDTLRNIFEAKKELFKGLAIEDKWDWDVSYPVITISFANGRIDSREQLDKKIISILEENQHSLGIECKDIDSTDICFRDLIIKARQKYNQNVVILVDEYDKPILDNIDEPTIAKSVRDGLVNLYSVIKGSDEYIKFAFLTGVSKFTKTSLFSGLNNLKDISLQKQYGDICGYSQNDVETTFKPYLDGVDMQELKSWYNGYNFLGSDMYNPFDILLFIDNDFQYSNYWFSTGTPTFLMKLIEKNNYFLPNLTNIKVDEKILDSFDIDNLDLEVILYQSGYLTIDKVTNQARGGLLYHLKVPNKEVAQSLSDHIIDFITSTDTTKRLNIQNTIYQALEDADIKQFESSITSMFATIPHQNYTSSKIAQYEGFYASVIFIYLQSLGFQIIGEDAKSEGRIDLTIITDKNIYIIEFKVDGKGDALQQIKDNNYALGYTNQNKDIYLVGIDFDTNKRNVSKFEWEKYQS